MGNSQPGTPVLNRAGAATGTTAAAAAAGAGQKHLSIPFRRHKQSGRGRDSGKTPSTKFDQRHSDDTADEQDDADKPATAAAAARRTPATTSSRSTSSSKSSAGRQQKLMRRPPDASGAATSERAPIPVSRGPSSPPMTTTGGQSASRAGANKRGPPTGLSSGGAPSQDAPPTLSSSSAGVLPALVKPSPKSSAGSRRTLLPAATAAAICEETGEEKVDDDDDAAAATEQFGDVAKSTAAAPKPSEIRVVPGGQAKKTEEEEALEATGLVVGSSLSGSVAVANKPMGSLMKLDDSVAALQLSRNEAAADECEDDDDDGDGADADHGPPLPDAASRAAARCDTSHLEAAGNLIKQRRAGDGGRVDAKKASRGAGGVSGGGRDGARSRPPVGLNRSFSVFATMAAQVQAQAVAVATSGRRTASPAMPISQARQQHLVMGLCGSSAEPSLQPSLLRSSATTTSNSTLQRLYLVQEDQRQRVRNWLDTQPFMQHLPVKQQKWTNSELASAPLGPNSDNSSSSTTNDDDNNNNMATTTKLAPGGELGDGQQQQAQAEAGSSLSAAEPRQKTVSVVGQEQQRECRSVSEKITPNLREQMTAAVSDLSCAAAVSRSVVTELVSSLSGESEISDVDDSNNEGGDNDDHNKPRRGDSSNRVGGNKSNETRSAHNDDEDGRSIQHGRNNSNNNNRKTVAKLTTKGSMCRNDQYEDRDADDNNDNNVATTTNNNTRPATVNDFARGHMAAATSADMAAAVAAAASANNNDDDEDKDGKRRGKSRVKAPSSSGETGTEAPDIEDDEAGDHSNGGDDDDGQEASDAAAEQLSEGCSLCHYLAAIHQAVANKREGTTDKQSVGPAIEGELDKQQACEHEACGRRRESKTTGTNAAGGSHVRPQRQTSTAAAAAKSSIWEDMKFEALASSHNRQADTAQHYEFQADEQTSTIRRIESRAAKAAAAAAAADNSDRSNVETTGARSSSAHSKLCNRAPGAVAVETGGSDDTTRDAAFRPQPADADSKQKSHHQTQPGPTRRAARVMRGVSLDRPSNKQPGSSGRHYHQQQRFQACATGGAGLKRISSRSSLMGMGPRSISQSSKLIVINSKDTFYTIQVASQEPLEPRTQKHNEATTNGGNSSDNPRHPVAKQANEQSSIGIGGGNVRSSNSSTRNSSDSKRLVESGGTSAVASETGLTKQDRASSLNRIDSSKKFLVKKISASNPRAFIKKKRQLGGDSRRSAAATSPHNQPSSTTVAKATTAAAATSLAGQARGQNKFGRIAAKSVGPRAVSQPQLAAGQLEKAAILASQMRERPGVGGGGGGSSGSAETAEQPDNAGTDLLSPSNSSSAGGRSLRSSEPAEADHRLLMEAVSLNWKAKQAQAFEAAAEDPAKSCNIAAKRLRELAAHLEHGSVPQSVLYQTLEYAASVLDTVTMDQISRVSEEEDGDLSEVQSDAVPNEVRKWLETTFTRNSISQKRKSEDKLKFRSVANAIRAGIVVDRIYRRMSASTPFVSAQVSNLLKSIDDWSFDCFSVNQASNGQVLKSVGYELFNRYGLMYKFKIPTTVLKNFLTQIESGYVKHKNPYHNNLHAADVTQTVHYMLWQAGLTNWLTDLEIFATLLAAIIHDYLHTGTTNNFHVMSQSDTALIYNDRAVLENFHICQAFTLMRNDDCNILAGLSKDEYREFRSLVIDMVLATDMSSHFQQIKAMKNILNHSDSFNADKSKVLSLVIHISDISHPAKEWELHSTWTQLLMEEFFRQGDREKELDLECSPLCDRDTTLVAESQLGFIEFIVSPSLEVCGDVLDRVHNQMAEANARPVLPASAKAASMVAASSATHSARSVQTAAALGEPPSSPTATPAAASPSPSAGRPLQDRGGGGGGGTKAAHHQQKQQQQPSPQQPLGQRDSPRSSASSALSSGSSLAASFVSSETLTSNLRKMIVSSSATIGRKLNISSSSSSSASSAVAPPAARPTATGQPTQTAWGTAARPAAPEAAEARTAALVIDDFEARQANYQHPVIRYDSAAVAAASRPRSAAMDHQPARGERRQTSGGGDGDTTGSTCGQDDNDCTIVTTTTTQVSGSGANEPMGAVAAPITDSANQSAQLSRLAAQPTTCELANRRNTSSGISTSSRSAPPLQYFKIHRPWIACLERNKKMWQERALNDAKARDLKEKLKQKQIDSAESGQQREQEPS